MPHVWIGKGQPTNMIGPYKRKKWSNTCRKNLLLFPTCDIAIAIVLGLPNSPGLPPAMERLLFLCLLDQQNVFPTINKLLFP